MIAGDMPKCVGAVSLVGGNVRGHLETIDLAL